MFKLLLTKTYDHVLKLSVFQLQNGRLHPENLSTLRMPITETDIKQKLEKALEPAFLEIIDESGGCGAKFSCTIVTDKFLNKGWVQRHRLVNSLLGEELKSIHALTLHTFTIEQWQKRNNQSDS